MDILDKIKQQRPLNIFGFFLIACIVLANVFPLFTGGDFWIDEAMVIQSVLTRDFAGLITSPPDYSQNAPLGYLIILKIFSLISRAEFCLRTPAVLFSFGSLFMAYKIAKNSLGAKNPLFFAGVAGLFQPMLFYGSQTKQYTLETFCVLLCVYAIDRRFKEKISNLTLSLVYAVSVWFSFLSIFFAFSGICVILFFEIRTYRKEKKSYQFLKNILPFAIVLCSVLLNLAIWALPSSGNIMPPEKAYWSKLNFPLIPKSVSDLKLMFAMFRNLATGFSKIGIVPVAFGVIMLIRYIGKNGIRSVLTKQTISVLITFIICLVASYLGKMPLIVRIFLFIYPLSLLTVAFLLENELSNVKSRYIKNFLIAFFCLIFAADFVLLAKNNFHVMDAQQLSISIKYLDKNLKKGDFIYVDPLALPQYSYLTGYKSKFDYFLDDKLVAKGNIIFGSTYRKNVSEAPYEYLDAIIPDKLAENVNAIVKHDTVYLLFAHEVPKYDSRGKDETIQCRLIDALKKLGNISLVQEKYGTPVYKFHKN